MARCSRLLLPRLQRQPWTARAPPPPCTSLRRAVIQPHSQATRTRADGAEPQRRYTTRYKDYSAWRCRRPSYRQETLAQPAAEAPCAFCTQRSGAGRRGMLTL